MGRRAADPALKVYKAATATRGTTRAMDLLEPRGMTLGGRARVNARVGGWREEQNTNICDAV